MPGKGVVTSAGVYLKLMGKILDERGAVSRDPLNGRMPRPLVVVHSGKTAMTRFGCFRIKDSRSISLAFGGCSLGASKACKTACKSDTGRTSRLKGYETVNMGSKMAARYKASMGEVKEEAMTEDG